MGERFTGFYSTINQEEGAQGASVIRKSYGEKSGSMTREQSEWLSQMMHRFDDIAHSLGVPTARPLGFETHPNGQPDHVILVEVVPYVGPDVQWLLNHDELTTDESMSLIEGVLSLNKKVADAGYPITLDTVFANYCVSENGIVYIDKMPPRQRLDDGSYLSEIPNPPEESRDVIERRHFTPIQNQVIYTQGLKALATDKNRHLAPLFKEAIGSIMGEDAYRFIDISSDERERMLLSPTPYDIDALRVIGWEAYHNGQLSLEAIKTAHGLAHIHYGGVLPTEAELEAVTGIIQKRNPVIFQA